MIKTWLLTIYFLSSGLYSETFVSAIDCNDVLIEAQMLKGKDVWTAICTGPDDEIFSRITNKDHIDPWP